MKTQLGTPYQKPTNKPDQSLKKDNVLIDIYHRHYGSEIYQKHGDKPWQRLSLSREQMANFYNNLKMAGFEILNA